MRSLSLVDSSLIVRLFRSSHWSRRNSSFYFTPPHTHTHAHLPNTSFIPTGILPFPMPFGRFLLETISPFSLGNQSAVVSWHYTSSFRIFAPFCPISFADLLFSGHFIPGHLFCSHFFTPPSAVSPFQRAFSPTHHTLFLRVTFGRNHIPGLTNKIGSKSISLFVIGSYISSLPFI